MSMRYDGLFHSAAQMRMARENRGREPLKGALVLLERQWEEPLGAAILSALRYQFYDDGQAAREAMGWLSEVHPRDFDLQGQAGCRDMVAWLSGAAMLRGHGDWAGLFKERLGEIVAIAEGMELASGALERLWQGALLLAVGVLCGTESCLRPGAELYREGVERVIHPEGFLKGVVDVDGGESTYAGQASGCCALVLMAEMGTHVGLNLWAYESRGVSPITATTYLLYYSIYPEQWRWGDGLGAEDAADVMRGEGAFIEIVHRRHPLRAIESLFAEHRPMFSARAGGLTTLTHGYSVEKKRRFWLF